MPDIDAPIPVGPGTRMPEAFAHLSPLWAELVAAAVLGTERRSFAPPIAAGALGEIISRIEAADQAGALLGVAATIALYRRAARLPSPMTTTLPLSTLPDEFPQCSPRAVQHLTMMIDGQQRASLPEWLAALVATRQRPPDALLPDLLELGRTQTSLRPAIVVALGARGHWLAGQNGDWEYASVGPLSSGAEGSWEAIQARWELGSRSVRLAVLRHLRMTDPARARELVAVAWASERADERSAFLATFASGLSMEDEPFLEAALDDRSKEVRRCGVALLARLPDSRLVGRMIARTQALIRWVPAERARLLGLRPGQPARIDVQLPSVCDAAMVRDGVEAKPPSDRRGLGEKAWWLFQMMCVVPPDSWSRGWNAPPEELIAAAEHGEWRTVLIDGWAAAAVTARDQRWAEALLHAAPDQADLLEALPPERQEVVLLDTLRMDCTPLHKHPVLELLRRTRHGWSVELTRAVLGAVRHHARTWRDSYDYQLRSALVEDFVLRMPPELLDEVAAVWPDDEGTRDRWQGTLDRLLITLQFRHDMLRELRFASPGRT